MHTPQSQQSGIGDITSNAKGTAARYNAGKDPLELIPLRVIAEQARRTTGGKFAAELAALFALARFQEGGGVDDLLDAITAIGPAWNECAAVFEYGRKKYDSWNWAKGFQWSVPIACAARHLLYGLMAGEQNDSESTLPHRGHFLCNIVMLLTFVRTFKEGDDRPSTWLSPMRTTEALDALELDARLIAESNAAAA
jgi:hypothetical protein